MLTIRDQQLKFFQLASRREFVDRLVPQMMEEYPAAAGRLQAEGIRSIINHAVDKGQDFGILTIGGITSLAGLMIQYGKLFERSPDREWALNTLNNAVWPEVVKLELLIEKMSGRAKGRIIVQQDEE